MDCPVCQNPQHVEVDTHCDGFTENLQECGVCGTVWISKGGRDIIIHRTSQSVING